MGKMYISNNLGKVKERAPQVKEGKISKREVKWVNGRICRKRLEKK